MPAKLIRSIIGIALLFIAGFIAGILIRTQYFGDSLVWIWNT